MNFRLKLVLAFSSLMVSGCSQLLMLPSVNAAAQFTDNYRCERLDDNSYTTYNLGLLSPEIENDIKKMRVCKFFESAYKNIEKTPNWKTRDDFYKRLGDEISFLELEAKLPNNLSKIPDSFPLG